MNADLIGQVLIALSTGYAGKAIVDYFRDRRRISKSKELVPTQVEAQRITNVAQQLEILERLNVRLEKRVQVLQNELDEREKLLNELRDTSAQLQQEIATLQIRCSQLQFKLDRIGER